MARKNALLIRQQNEIRLAEYGIYKATKDTYIHYMTDTACIALNNLGWGKERINTFIEEWGKVFDSFVESMQDTAETDYYRAKFDERIKPLCREGDFKPFETRYQFLPEMKYGKG